MRTPRLALAALIAAAACTDSTPTASPARAAQRDSAPSPSVSASVSAPASLYSGYSPRSPHWSHITTMMTDFYYSWTPTERAWAGTHYDYAMSGSGTAWRAANPTVGHLPYALLWTVIVPTSASPSVTTAYYADMKRWYAAHPQYAIEKAFIHRKGVARDSAGRLTFSVWGSTRWTINPADGGAIAYSVNRLQRVTASESGVFFDESESGGLNAHLGSMQELSSVAAYASAYASLIATIRRAIGTKMVMLNTAEYMTAADRADAVAAGAVHLEMFNNFKQSGMIDRWKWIESLNASGVFVDFVSTYGTQDIIALGSSYPRGNSATSVQRAKLWELASYYMAVSANPRLLALQLENAWNKPYSTLWIRAQEANIGHPRASRIQTKLGTDPLGNSYIEYTRDFDRALVVLRLQQGWNAHSYGDGTAVTFALPAGRKWLPLNADGTVGTAVTSIRLRNSEAAILLKSNTM